MTVIKVKKKVLGQLSIFLFAMLIAAAFFLGISFTTNYAIGATINITNNTVLARVNITNTEPNITSVVATPSTIDLIANDFSYVTCNATVFDYNGWQDINANATNATFYIQSVGINGAIDNNHRYVNRSCGSCRQAAESANPSTTAYCDCRFALQYYANDSSAWVCNMTVKDKGGTQKSGSEINFTDSDASSTVTVSKLLAINTSTLLDYGNLSVTETSSEITQNVTNVGNVNLNLSLRGYGGTDESTGNNLSMICDFGNITFGYERYLVGTDQSGTPFSSMRNLTNQTARLNFTFPARVDDSSVGWDRNSTFWRLQVPLSVGGICNGTIIFGAVDAEV